MHLMVFVDVERRKIRIEGRGGPAMKGRHSIDDIATKREHRAMTIPTKTTTRTTFHDTGFGILQTKNKVSCHSAFPSLIVHLPHPASPDQRLTDS
jgi:hypothetical protein